MVEEGLRCSYPICKQPTPTQYQAQRAIMESQFDYEEAVAWLRAVYDHGKSTPNEALFSYFRGNTKQDDLTLPVVNLMTASCKAVFGDSTSTTGAAADAQLDPAACSAYLYYMVAENLLQQQFPRNALEQTAAATATAAAGQQRFKGMVKPHNPPACRQLVSCQEFHMPLIECALQLVHAITHPSQAAVVPCHASEVLQRQDRAALLWQASRIFSESFGPSSTLPMPHSLQAYLGCVQQQLLPSLAFQSGSVFFEVLTAGGGCQFQPGDITLANNVVAAYSAMAVQQTQLVAWHVQEQQQHAGNSPCLSSDFHEQCAWLMDQVLLHHLEVCFGVHMAVVVACVVYVTAKVLQASLSFSTLTQVIADQLGCSADLFTHTEVSTQPLQHGDLRAFYNNRFLPSVQGPVRSYLQQYRDRAAQSITGAAGTAPATGPVCVNSTCPTPITTTEPAGCSAAQELDNSRLFASQALSQPPQPNTKGATTRAAFKTIQQDAPTSTAFLKPHFIQEQRPASYQAAALDKENATATTTTATATATTAGPAALLSAAVPAQSLLAVKGGKLPRNRGGAAQQPMVSTQLR